MKNYDQLLDEVAIKYGYVGKKDMFMSCAYTDIMSICREAAERYRAQVDLPSDDEIHDYTLKIYNERVDSRWHELLKTSAKCMRDHISKQLKQGI